MYRTAAATTVGRTIVEVEVRDPRFVRGGTPVAELVDQVTGRTLTAARRRGKLLVLDLDGGSEVVADMARDAAASAVPDAVSGRAPGGAPLDAVSGRFLDGAGGRGARRPIRLGLRFGMTGRLLVNGSGPIDRLLYSSARDVPRWDRLVLHFEGHHQLAVRDPRLLGGVVLDPDEDALGPDALTLTLAQLAAALGNSAAPLKARLLDQAKVAGIGNLVADEVLWGVDLAPDRQAGSLSDAEQRRLARGVTSTLRLLLRRGGSHTGDLMAARVPGGRCPRDGAELCRSTIGGRTSWWCPRHQR